MITFLGYPYTFLNLVRKLLDDVGANTVMLLESDDSLRRYLDTSWRLGVVARICYEWDTKMGRVPVEIKGMVRLSSFMSRSKLP